MGDNRDNSSDSRILGLGSRKIHLRQSVFPLLETVEYRVFWNTANYELNETDKTDVRAASETEE